MDILHLKLCLSTWQWVSVFKQAVIILSDNRPLPLLVVFFIVVKQSNQPTTHIWREVAIARSSDKSNKCTTLPQTITLKTEAVSSCEMTIPANDPFHCVQLHWSNSCVTVVTKYSCYTHYVGSTVQYLLQCCLYYRVWTNCTHHWTT